MNSHSLSRRKSRVGAGPKTLAVDIGGSGIKVLVLDSRGLPAGKRMRSATPSPPKPKPVVEIIRKLAATQRRFDRVSVGFPGVVIDGVIHTAVNLHPDWIGFNLANALRGVLGKPVRVANDADIQGYGVIRGAGVELVLTLGTGLGAALFVDGHLVPNLELGHHPFRKGQTYEEQVGRAALDEVGLKRWNRRVRQMLDLLGRIINYQAVYLGGGNAKKLEGPLPANAHIVSNEAGLLGGIALWKHV